MFKIFADAHKIIAKEINNNIFNIYGVKLDEESLLWGSILPDILPRYKMIRHYKEESLDYVSKEIVNIIYNNRNLEIGNMDSMSLKLLSKRIGIVSHYICDYTCLAHAQRWTFKDSMFKHLKYESKLNECAKHYNFKSNLIELEDFKLDNLNDSKKLEKELKLYIDDVIIRDYSKKESFENDLNYGLSLNLKISYLILNAIINYSSENSKELILNI